MNFFFVFGWNARKICYVFVFIGWGYGLFGTHFGCPQWNLLKLIMWLTIFVSLQQQKLDKSRQISRGTTKRRWFLHEFRKISRNACSTWQYLCQKESHKYAECQWASSFRTMTASAVNGMSLYCIAWRIFISDGNVDWLKSSQTCTWNISVELHFECSERCNRKFPFYDVSAAFTTAHIATGRETCVILTSQISEFHIPIRNWYLYVI